MKLYEDNKVAEYFTIYVVSYAHSWLNNSDCKF